MRVAQYLTHTPIGKGVLTVARPFWIYTRFLLSMRTLTVEALHYRGQPVVLGHLSHNSDREIGRRLIANLDSTCMVGNIRVREI